MNPQISAFMVLDAPLLKETGKINYAIKCEKRMKKTLLAMKVEALQSDSVWRRRLRGGSCWFS